VPLANVKGPVRVRFRNTGGKAYRTVEAHLVYEVPTTAPVQVSFFWDQVGHPMRSEFHTFAAKPGAEDATWSLEAGKVLKTRSVSFRHVDP
jgi:hypothetical protein